MDRRDFFKFFGVGATVAALEAGRSSPLLPQARIIEPPKIEIIAPPKFVPADHMPTAEILDIDVNIRCKNGRRYHMNAKAFVTQFDLQPAMVTTRDSSFQTFATRGNCRLTLELIGDLPNMIMSDPQYPPRGIDG